MNDDSWLVSKQAHFLDDSIKSMRISGELMECLGILMKQMLTETEKMNIVDRCPSIPHLAERALELIRQSEEMIGTLSKESHEIDALRRQNLPSSTLQPLTELDYDKPIVKSLRGKDDPPPDKLPVYPIGGPPKLVKSAEFSRLLRLDTLLTFPQVP